MGNTIDRRGFLGLLAGFGISLKLAAPLPAATPDQIDEAWTVLSEDPVVFLVDRAGSLTRQGDLEPKIRSDVYDIATRYIEGIEALIDEVDAHDELRGHFQSLAEEERFALTESDDHAPAPMSKKTATILAALADPDDGWQEWLRLEGEPRLPFFVAQIDAWLAAPVNWLQCDFWPPGWSSQERCMEFFQQLDADIVEALGVVIVEGDRPGSTYYAAELVRDVAEANRAAAALDLPFRFTKTA